MARIRSVKPSLRTSQTVARWRFEVRYFWVLLWGYLDDLGRGLDIPKAIAGDCYPLDDNVTAATVNRWLDIIASTKVDQQHDPPLCRYEVGGRRYIHSVYWSEHQRPARPTPSMHPPCPTHELLPESIAEEAVDNFERQVSKRDLEASSGAKRGHRTVTKRDLGLERYGSSPNRSPPLDSQPGHA